MNYGFPVVAYQTASYSGGSSFPIMTSLSPPFSGPFGAAPKKKKRCLKLIAKYERAVLKGKTKRSVRLERKLLKKCRKAGELARGKRAIARISAAGALTVEETGLDSASSAALTEMDTEADVEDVGEDMAESDVDSEGSSMPGWLLPVGIVGALGLVAFLAMK